MPPRRKRAAASSENSTAVTPSKISRGEDGNQISGISVQFEWKGDRNKWTTYNDEHCGILCKTCEKKQSSVTLHVADGVDLVVSLKEGKQTNKKTGYERDIRVSVKQPSENDFHMWQWEEASGSWQSYPVEASITLEKELQATPSSLVTVTLGRRQKHQVDVSQMEAVQTSSKESFAVRREKSDAAECDVGQGDPGAAKSSVKRQDSEGGDNKPTTSKSKAKSQAKSKAKSEGPTEKIRTLVVKGKAPVDCECQSKVSEAHVYCEGNDVYDIMLNQTNVQFNNNKFFLLQLLKDDAGPAAYSVWFRWGRVGQVGQSSLTTYGPNLEQAKKVFCKKFSDKTKNEWGNRKNFEKVAGKYDLLEVDYAAGSDADTCTVDGPVSAPADVPDSKLDQRLQDLISMICDVKNMEQTMKEMKYDAKKAPLGKLTKNQIQAGYQALQEVEECIKNKDFGHQLVTACNKFYTRIPHDFGMRTPPLIRTEPEVKAKNDMLAALADIEVAMSIIKHQLADENPIDTHYNDMHCDLQPVDKSSPEFKLLENYLHMTHAPTHNQYQMQLMDAFEINRDGEERKFKDCGNRMLLWHGSRLSNYLGILSKGLRIAPPEAPVTGYMFGKGIYFADMSSKSANYCYATLSKKVGLLLLSEVSLGQTNELLAADIKADKLPSGKHSVKGLGSIAPHPGGYKNLDNGTVVPCGKPGSTGVNNPQGYTLNYNEFIVYNPDQVKMRYLMKVQFNFK